MKNKWYFIVLLSIFIIFTTSYSFAETRSFTATLKNFDTMETDYISKADNELAWYFNLTGGNVSKINILGIRPHIKGIGSGSSYYIYKSLTQGAKRYYYKDSLDIHQGTEVSLYYKKDDRSKSKEALRIEAKFTP